MSDGFSVALVFIMPDLFLNADAQHRFLALELAVRFHRDPRVGPESVQRTALAFLRFVETGVVSS